VRRTSSRLKATSALLAALEAGRARHRAHARARPPGRVRAHITLEIFFTRFRASDGYRLRDRRPLGNLIFRDRHIRVGGGIDWALANWLHFELEAGAVAERRLRVREEDLGTLLSEHADPSAYFEVRFDIRL